jgi:hypothetical protein
MCMSTDALDFGAARLDELGAEQKRLRVELRQQVEEFGFTGALAELLSKGAPRNLRCCSREYSALLWELVLRRPHVGDS